HVVEPAAVVPGEHAERDPDGARDDHRGEPHDERHAGPVEHPAQDVAPQRVRPQRMRRVAARAPHRRLEPLEQVASERVPPGAGPAGPAAAPSPAAAIAATRTSMPTTAARPPRAPPSRALTRA